MDFMEMDLWGNGLEGKWITWASGEWTSGKMNFRGK